MRLLMLQDISKYFAGNVRTCSVKQFRYMLLNLPQGVARFRPCVHTLCFETAT
jgi:hypothetical protein